MIIPALCIATAACGGADPSARREPVANGRTVAAAELRVAARRVSLPEARRAAILSDRLAHRTRVDAPPSSARLRAAVAGVSPNAPVIPGVDGVVR